MTIRAIGLTGGAGTGKTTFARAVQQEFLVDGQFAIILSFATMLRVEVIEDYTLSEEILSPQFDKTTLVAFPPHLVEICLNRYGQVPRTVRELFQFHGTYRRKQDPEYWLQEITRSMNGSLISNRDQFDEVCYIFDDVRYQNEIDYIRKAFIGGSRILKLEREIKNLASAHESENQKLKVDLVLDLDKDTVGMLPIAARCDYWKGRALGELTRAPRA
jgi:hypothetical protein